MIDAKGTIYFDEVSLKWKIRKQGSFFRRMLTSDQVGDLRKSAANLQSKWEKYTLEKLKMSDIPEPTVVMILNNSETEIDGKDPQMDLIRIDKLKDQVRKRPPLTGPILAKIVDLTKILPQ